MKRTWIRCALTAFLICLWILPAQAQTIEGKSGWLVRFTADAKMESNFRTEEYNDPIHGLQPGDDVNYTVAISNEYSKETDWYMTNQVLHSLEDRSRNPGTSGGAYSYKLIYVDPKGAERILYSSDKVGGSNVDGSSKNNPAGQGLHEATNALSDYFYLDTLKNGEQGTIKLNVALEGESQGNDYQDTLADLQMKFAVEVLGADTTQRPEIVKTGDETNIWKLVFLTSASGLFLLFTVMHGIVMRKEDK